MSWRVPAAMLVCLLALAAAGCGSSGGGKAKAQTPVALLRHCLRQAGYAVTAETVAQVRTAPRSFKFTAVWNLLNPDRVALAMTFSKDAVGARQAAVWTRKTNARIGKGKVKAPVVQFGTVDVLWTSEPGTDDARDIYGCVRQHAASLK